MNEAFELICVLKQRVTLIQGNCCLVDLSFSQDLIHEHIGMERPYFSEGWESKRNSSVYDREREREQVGLN